MARIVDVAREAGVSTATVSRVLNGKQVRADLAEAVHRAVAALEYSPDRTARSLRRRHSEVLALILPDIENPFFTAVARGVEDVASGAGYSVVLCNSDDLPAKERRYLHIAESENMAGVIIAPASGNPHLRSLVAKARGVVVLDRSVPDAVDQVAFDNVGLGRRGVELLAARGFQRIACVTGPATTSTAVERAEGWRAGLREAGLEVREEWLIHANFRVDGGHDAATTLLSLDDAPDAVLATNNLVAVGILRALAELGGAAAGRGPGAGDDGSVTSGGGGPERAGDGGPAGTRGGPARPGTEALVEARGQRGAGVHSIGVGAIGELPFATSRMSDLSLVPLNPRELGTTAARMLLERIDGLDVAPRRIVQPLG